MCCTHCGEYASSCCGSYAARGCLARVVRTPVECLQPTVASREKKAELGFKLDSPQSAADRGESQLKTVCVFLLFTAEQCRRSRGTVVKCLR